MSRFYLMAMICLLCAMLGACSDDGGDDTGSNYDVGSDVGSDVGDFDADAERNDVEEADAGDSDATEQDGKIAIGEACPSECPNLMGDTPYSMRCEGCDNGYCYYPINKDVGYCTTDECNSQAACNELGEGLICDSFGFCVPE